MIYQPGILIGQVIKIQGYEGTLIVKLEKIFIENFLEMETVFLEIEGKEVPFFVSGLEYNGGDILKISFRDYNTYDKVHQLKGCKIYSTEEGKSNKKENEISEFIDFTVILKDGQSLGKIIDVIDNPGQFLLKIKPHKEGEVLIPFHEDLIIDIDKTQKLIRMDLPEGLADVN